MVDIRPEHLAAPLEPAPYAGSITPGEWFGTGRITWTRLPTDHLLYECLDPEPARGDLRDEVLA